MKNRDFLSGATLRARKLSVAVLVLVLAVPAFARMYEEPKSGTWQTLREGRIWRLRIQSPGAKSLNLGFTRYEMSEGAKLWVYDPKHAHVEGPYTSRHRSQKAAYGPLSLRATRSSSKYSCPPARLSSAPDTVPVCFDCPGRSSVFTGAPGLERSGDPHLLLQTRVELKRRPIEGIAEPAVVEQG